LETQSVYHFSSLCSTLTVSSALEIHDIRYIALLTSENRTLNLKLYNFAKYELNVAKLSRLMKYCVLNERVQFCAKILLHYTDIVIFVLGHFIVTRPVCSRRSSCCSNYRVV